MLSLADQLINEDVFQYIELTPIPNIEIETFLSYDLPYTIHITTERHGVNIADTNTLLTTVSLTGNPVIPGVL